MIALRSDYWLHFSLEVLSRMPTGCAGPPQFNILMRKLMGYFTQFAGGRKLGMVDNILNERKNSTRC